MRLGKIGWLLVVTGVVMAGCSKDDIVDDLCTQDADCAPAQQCELATGQCVAREDRDLRCDTAADCLSLELCHPTAGVCVRTCESSTDCPDAAKTCAAMSATDSRTVCQCSTDLLCNMDRQSPGLVCSDLEGVCRPKCAADADCGPGRTCNTGTGQCEVKGIEKCTSAADCLSSELCHPTAGVCVQTCSSGADCPDSAKTCAAVSATDSRTVCQCSTDALCNAGRDTAAVVCSDLDNVCTPRCSADVDCGAGRACDTATGQCEVRTHPRCTSATDCLSSELCHPTAGVCVRTCASGVDCPDSAKTCAEVSASDSRKVCQCSTDALCNAGLGTAELVCANLGSVCAPKCTADSHCGPGRCNTETGQCQADSTGLACTGEGQSLCDYGTHFCASGRCARLPVPDCINYTNFPHKADLGTTAFILYGARLVSAATDTNYCPAGAPKRVRIDVSAYSDRSFPPTKNELGGFFYVNATGTRLNAFDLVFPASGYTVSGANRERAVLPVSLCVPESSRSLSAGFYFTQGNFFCFQANY